MKKYLLLIYFTLGCIFFFESCDVTYLDAPVIPDEQELLRLINDARSAGCKCGDVNFPPVGNVTWNDQLKKAAQNHSNDMDSHNNLSHTGSDGSSVGDRISRVGYTWTTIGENIAVGLSSEKKVIEGWLNSPGHCQNIMNANFLEMGVATSGPYWTQVFAAN